MAVTPGLINGNGVLVYVGGIAIGCTTGGTLTITNNQIESTCKDNDGAITYLPGAQDWNIQVNGNTKFDAPYGLPELQVAAKTKQTVVVRMQTGNPDDPYWEGDAFISSFSWDNQVNAVSTYAVTFSPRGPIYLYNS